MSDRDEFMEIVEKIAELIRNERVRSYNEGVDAERERCADIALAIDSKRGNEKEIYRAIRAQSEMKGDAE